jgi:hypothetical protein
MNAGFLRAVVDTLLPGEAAAPAGAQRTLPSGSAAGLDLGKHAEATAVVLDAIAKAAGGPDRFVEADEAARTQILTSVQSAAPGAFAALLALLLPDYCETSDVLRALGWRTDPPQPQGHIVPGMDEATRARLERVRLGPQRWREEA